MNKLIIFVATMFHLPIIGICQDNSMINQNMFIVEFNYKNGIGAIKYDSISIDNKHNVQDLQFGYLFSLKNNMHIGLAAGIAGFHNPSRNTVPLELKYMYSSKLNKTIISLNLDIGYAAPLGETFSEGATLSASLKLKPKLFRNNNIGFSFGYTFQEFKSAKLLIITPVGSNTIIDNTIAHLLFVGISYTFW